MSDDPVVQAPARLIDEPTEVATWLAHSEAQFRGNLDEGQAWKRVKPHLNAATPTTKRNPILIASLATSAAAMAIGWYAGAHYSKGASKSENSKSQARLLDSATQPATSQRLPSGESVLADGSRVVVLEATQSQHNYGSEGAIVSLVSGRLELFVARQSSGKWFTVDCPRYEMRSLGARFNVDVASGCVKLQVSDGKVEILAGKIPVTSVVAAEHWASDACVH
jgi:ferric-dicitrate binding protein FerR (iron transport regulator)